MSVRGGRISDVGQTAPFYGRTLAELLRKQKSVITRSQAAGCSMTDSALRHRTRVNGPWQVVFPGVYVSRPGTLTAAQRQIAAWLYAGRSAAITGPAALEWHGIRAPRTDLVDVLVPVQRKRRDIAFVRLHRTSVMPTMIFPDGEICFVPAARAVADTVRELREADEVRAVVGGVRRGRGGLAAVAPVAW
jgi:hypothetical protein